MEFNKSVSGQLVFRLKHKTVSFWSPIDTYLKMEFTSVIRPRLYTNIKEEWFLHSETLVEFRKFKTWTYTIGIFLGLILVLLNNV